MESLKKNAEFKECYHRGKSYADRYLVLYVLPRESEGLRLGISVSKKVGNSVVRHHITRLVREVARLHEDRFNSGLDLAVIARISAKEASFDDIGRSFLSLSERAGICEKGLRKAFEEDRNRVRRSKKASTQGTPGIPSGQ